MRLEIRDKEPEKKEPVAQLWLDKDASGAIVLYYRVADDHPCSLAYFNEEQKRFHIFDNDAHQLGYKVTSTKHPYEEG